MTFFRHTMKNSESGISLVVTFLIMTVLLGIVLSLSTILIGQIKIIGNITNSIVATSYAQTGLERLLYLNKKQVPIGASRGLCNICNVCSLGNCSNCKLVSRAYDGSNGCGVTTCSNCTITYDARLDNGSYSIEANIIGNNLHVTSKGYYRDAARSIEVTTKK